MAYLAREEERYPECHGEACPFYIPAKLIGPSEYCRRAEKEADG
jgi:hypothetical protein